jgi:hypothetical protein
MKFSNEFYFKLTKKINRNKIYFSGELKKVTLR